MDLKRHRSPDPHKPLLWLEPEWLMFWVSWNWCQFKAIVHQSLKSLFSSFSPRYSHSGKRLCVSLLGERWEKDCLHFWPYVRVLCQRNPTPPSLWVYKLVQVWKLLERLWLSVFTIQVRLLLTWTGTFLFIQIKWQFWRLLCESVFLLL